jgi:hypothetical protein
MKFFTSVLFVFYIIGSIKAESIEKRETLPSSLDLFRLNKNLIEVVMLDNYSPPVASRAYAYPNLGFYYALQMCKPSELKKIKLRDFDYYLGKEEIKQIDISLFTQFIFTGVSKYVVLTEKEFTVLEQTILKDAQQRKVSKKKIETSISKAQLFVRSFNAWVKNDNYIRTRAQTRFTSIKEPGYWQETAPDYTPALEPNWNKMRPILLESVSSFEMNNFPSYSSDTSSAFYKMVYEVYEKSKKLSPEEEQVAWFWDDNPNVTEHHGHLITMKHKISPPGHWLNIVAQVCEGRNIFETTRAFTLTSVTMYDALIVCWNNKFVSNLVRPVTYINEHIDPNWNSLIQTPPFPEYTSGHSVVSACAAEVLTLLFGEDYNLIDKSNVRFGFSERMYNSFHDAAWEVSLSRFYGGIHYYNSIKDGNTQGKEIGKYMWNLYMNF